jgi:magnesium transporter
MADTLAVLDRLSPDKAAQVLERISDDAATAVLSRTDPNRSALLLSRMDEAVRQGYLDRLSPELSSELRELLSYPPDTAGGLMDARVTTFRPGMTIEQTLRRLRHYPRKGLHAVFVVDEQGRLLGSVPIQTVAVTRPKETLQNVLETPTVFVQPMASREEVVELLSRHRLSLLPVVDLEGRLVGVLRHDALVAATAEEVSADIQTMVGASKEERALSKVSFAVRKRLPWLEINLGTAFLAASVVGLFEETIARYTALAVLLPVVAGQSGNTGAQALAVVMRGLALREIRVRQWLRVATKEISVGLLNGVAVALTTSFFVYLWSRSVGLALVIGSSMVASMAIAGLAGAVIPILLTALRQDPAQSSSIVLTTITDVAGFFSFLGIATLLLG